MSDEATPRAAPVVVCFAVPNESRLFRAAMVERRDRPAISGHRFRPIIGRIDGCHVTIFHTGVGESASARTAFLSLLENDKPAFVVSAGYAGGLDPVLSVGDLVVATNFSAPLLLDRAALALSAERLHRGLLHTAAVAAETIAAKAALRAATGATAVDMETAWLAERCAAVGIPLFSLRVISDAAGDIFPVPGHILYDIVRQRPRYLALLLWLALHPAQIAPFARFVRGLAPARARLTYALRALVASL